MTNYDIVIIDSGLTLNSQPFSYGICIEKNNTGILISKDYKDEIGHGTIIYSIINKHVDATKIFNIKLSQHQNEYDEACLVAALEYIKNNITCKIINISLGIIVSDNLDKLYKVCSELTKSGCVIISAFDNEGCYSYPATFDCVIGVDSKNSIKKISEFDFVENSPINILAKGSIQRITMPDGKNIIVGGSSVACAHITSILYKKISKNFNLQSALSYLKSKSKCIYSFSKLENLNNSTYFKINTAVVFPVSKEAHSFIRFSDMLSFYISDYYDVRQSGKVGRRLSTYYEEIKSDKCIMDIEHIDFEDVDTIILGHLDKINYIYEHDYKAELIKKAITNGINIYSFDPLDRYIDMLNHSNIKYFYPEITQSNLPYNTFCKLYKISKPVVGIFGTSSQQGKFSLQLALKRELELMDYNVGTIGTEPQSLLFDFDVVFPMGYNSTVHLNNSEIVLYLNNEINKLCQKQKEIILTASQAQTIPYCFNNLLEFPSMQYHFALGTRPDAIIICINYHDEIQYIRNTVYTLIGLTNATVIAFVIYPFTYGNNQNGIYGTLKHKLDYTEYKEKYRILLDEFNIPTFMLGNQKDVKDICDLIIDFF